MPPNVADIIHDCRLFSQVQPAGFARLVTIARLCTYSKGDLIFREDAACPGVYVVGSGLVRVFKTAAGGKEHVLHIVGPGNTFAEVAAMGGFNVPASAEAVADTTCALLPLAPFRKALAEDHELCLGMMTGMTMWVRHLVNLMEDVVLRDAAGRLARFFLTAESDEEGAVVLPGLKRHLASHLNLTSETFSRTLRRLIDAGLIAELDNARVKVLNRHGLNQVAEGLFPKM
jgi:CRP/FNR family transcriptional regulator, dissimilatory nitrate respiration regulator